MATPVMELASCGRPCLISKKPPSYMSRNLPSLALMQLEAKKSKQKVCFARGIPMGGALRWDLVRWIWP